jgi:hypothetical protein
MACSYNFNIFFILHFVFLNIKVNNNLMYHDILLFTQACFNDCINGWFWLTLRVEQ